MATRQEAIDFLYANGEKFVKKAAPIFGLNDWKWAHYLDGKGPRVPSEQDIHATVSSLIWECVKNEGQNCASTGRIQVFLRRTDRGEWISGIELVPVSVTNY